jgi:hypothetical protein
LLIHSGEKPFKCTVTSCKQRFRTYGHLKDHMSTHFNLRFFHCEKCGASFSRKWTLKKHYYTHTGEKPFNCQYCHKKFADKSNLTTHMKKHLANGCCGTSNLTAVPSQAVCKDSAMNFSVISKPELNHENLEENLNLNFSKPHCEGTNGVPQLKVASNCSFLSQGQQPTSAKTSSCELGLGIKKTDSKNNLNLSTHILETHPHEVFDLYENYEHDNYTTFGNFYETFSEGFDPCEDHTVVGGNNFQNFQNLQNFENIQNFVTLPAQSTAGLSIDKDFMETDKMFYELFKITNSYIN